MANRDCNLDKIRQQAQSETTDQNTLRLLSNSKEPEIRRYVAANANTPVELSKELAEDLSCWVRVRIAQNQVTPKSIFSSLARFW